MGRIKKSKKKMRSKTRTHRSKRNNKSMKRYKKKSEKPNKVSRKNRRSLPKKNRTNKKAPRSGRQKGGSHGRSGKAGEVVIISEAYNIGDRVLGFSLREGDTTCRDYNLSIDDPGQHGDLIRGMILTKMNEMLTKGWEKVDFDGEVIRNKGSIYGGKRITMVFMKPEDLKALESNVGGRVLHAAGTVDAKMRASAQVDEKLRIGNKMIGVNDFETAVKNFEEGLNVTCSDESWVNLRKDDLSLGLAAAEKAMSASASKAKSAGAALDTGGTGEYSEKVDFSVQDYKYTYSPEVKEKLHSLMDPDLNLLQGALETTRSVAKQRAGQLRVEGSLETVAEGDEMEEEEEEGVEGGATPPAANVEDTTALDQKSWSLLQKIGGPLYLLVTGILKPVAHPHSSIESAAMGKVLQEGVPKQVTEYRTGSVEALSEKEIEDLLYSLVDRAALSPSGEVDPELTSKIKELTEAKYYKMVAQKVDPEFKWSTLEEQDTKRVGYAPRKDLSTLAGTQTRVYGAATKADRKKMGNFSIYAGIWELETPDKIAIGLVDAKRAALEQKRLQEAAAAVVKNLELAMEKVKILDEAIGDVTQEKKIRINHGKIKLLYDSKFERLPRSETKLKDTHLYVDQILQIPFVTGNTDHAELTSAELYKGWYRKPEVMNNVDQLKLQLSAKKRRKGTKEV